MDEAMNVGLEEEIIAELMAELHGEPTFNEEVLAIKVRNAMREVYELRGYEDESEQFVQKDMRRQYIKIKKRALYDYNQIGLEGEDGHSENGTSRNYVDRIQYCGAVNRISRIR